MKKKFTSIKQIPKAAIEMIDDVQWWNFFAGGVEKLPSNRVSSKHVLEIVNLINAEGVISFSNSYKFFYIESRELEDKSYGKILYEKIHGLA